jgi:hypothetical protein
MNRDLAFLDAFRRVSRDHPCPVCAKPDWCVVARDGSVALCQRVESGTRAGEAGWLHRLCDDYGLQRRSVCRVRRARTGGLLPDFSNFAREFQRAVQPDRLAALALDLGLSVEALSQLGIGWSTSHGAWSFPMSDARGNILGIRLRMPNARKLSVKGSKEGLFVPADCSGEHLLIAERPTDAAALLDIGFASVVGRPSCTGGIKLLAELVQRSTTKDAVIVADGDDPGQRGAANLASVLTVYVRTVRVIAPPPGTKDAREWLRRGGTRKDVQDHIAAAPLRRLALQGRRIGRGNA